MRLPRRSRSAAALLAFALRTTGVRINLDDLDEHGMEIFDRSPTPPAKPGSEAIDGHVSLNSETPRVLLSSANSATHGEEPFKKPPERPAVVTKAAGEPLLPPKQAAAPPTSLAAIPRHRDGPPARVPRHRDGPSAGQRHDPPPEVAGDVANQSIAALPRDAWSLAVHAKEVLERQVLHLEGVVAESEQRPRCGASVGCSTWCSCSWFQRCYVKQSEGSNVGICGASIWLQVSGSLSIIVFMKATMMHWKNKLEACCDDDDDVPDSASSEDGRVQPPRVL